MDFALTAEDRVFLDEFRTYLDGLRHEGHYRERELVSPDHQVDDADVARRKKFLQRLGRDGWLGISWPLEYGGRGGSGVQQWLMNEELHFRKLPAMLLGVSIIGPTLLKIGSRQHQADYLPGLLAGDLEFCLGYTEPEAGTDLASLQTRARRDGDEYIINGQKIYTTGAHYATHVWLCARTGDRHSRSRGVTVLIVPTDAPGITIRPLYTGADYHTNEVFYEDVRVPASSRVGEENEGWKVISTALQFERIPTASRLVQQFGEIMSWATAKDETGRRPADDAIVRVELGRLATHLEISRLFALKLASMVANDQMPTAQGSMAKVWNTEFGQRLPEKAIALMGAAGSVHVGEPYAPLRGLMELVYRESTVYKFAAGTNEVQRDIIAQRGIGLPRSR
jgi:3-oxocholest-4-en-26-oyl-CoA dehydrogenase alpha subunit